MHKDIARTLLHGDQIRTRVREMAREIASHYDPHESALTLVPVLSGSIIFLADLIRELPLKMKLALVHVSAYPGTTTTAREPKTIHEPIGDICGRHVLVI